MWWYGLVVWGVWEIVIFCFFLFAGGLGNCDFLFAKLGTDVCKQTLFWPFFLPLLSKRWSAGVGRTSSLYRGTRWPTNVSPPPLQKAVCRCWTYIVLVQKHPLTHQCFPPSSLKGGQRVLDAQSVIVLKHLLAVSPTWSVRPAGPAWAYVLALCKHPLKFSCGRASTSSRQARFSQCYNENPRGSGPKFKDENLAALQMNMLVTRPFVVLGPADWCAPIFGSNLTCSSPTVAYHLRKKKYWRTVTSILGMSSWSCLITVVCWALTGKELAKKYPQLRWNWETGPEKNYFTSCDPHHDIKKIVNPPLARISWELIAACRYNHHAPTSRG